MFRRLGSILALVLLTAAPLAAQSNLVADVQAERAKYGRPLTPTEQCAIVNAVAYKHRDEGWGVSSKPNGANCVRIEDGAKIATDILHHKGSNHLFDVLVSGEDPAWQDVGEPQSADRVWLAAVKPAGAVVPDPGPTDPPATDPPASSLGPVLLKVIALLEEIRDGQAAQRAGQEAQTAALKAAIAELQAQVKLGVKIRF